MILDLNKILEIIKDPDLKIKIAQLYGENISLKEENHKLRQKLDHLNKNEETRSKLKHKNNHYFIDEEDGPYCTKCWDADEKLIRLHADSPSEGLQYFICPNCKTNTHIGEHVKSHAEDINLY